MRSFRIPQSARLLGVAVLLAWCYLLVPLIGIADPKEIVEQAQDIRSRTASDAKMPEPRTESETTSAVQDTQRRQTLSRILVAFGLLSAIWAIFQLKYWRPFVLVSSMAYLVTWFMAGSLSTMAPWTAMRLRWMAARALDFEVDFWAKDVIVPVVFALTIICLGVGVFRYRQETNDEGSD